ncbi:hypothetical protein [Amycolatopsis sp. BJA-103]|uniref:hypothetical protein n=1 Tax=Amycolatopsis sp. BJA-103 TaxID=1911175 RepID=UPI000C78A78E|nr:hypothetical protein [Amycolatopsis sp. BJA-103]AUI56780.1 hypothetical protein BKN51_00175 [Amycolatopsis sp. BJA-103]PNE13101.1 hypothetical protein B1H26_42315 [Amycolatopsis sp. BJA-103]
MTSLIWATPAEVRAYPESGIPLDMPDDALGQKIDKAARAIERVIIRWPTVDVETGRAFDADVRAQMIAAVAETIKARRKAEAIEASLGGLAPILAAGGSISTKTLSASTGTSSSGSTGAPIGDRAPRVPLDAIDALQAAGLIGGSARTW